MWTADGAGRRSAHATTTTVTVTHQGPAASFDPPQGNVAGYPTGFDDSSSQGDDPITSWRWSFGDGSTSTDENPVHTYAQPGTYTATLTVTASDGQTAIASNQVDVAPYANGYRRIRHEDRVYVSGYVHTQTVEGFLR